MEKFNKIINDLEDNIVFKFMPFNQYALEALINKRLYFGDPNFQNDPLESHYILDISQVSDKYTPHFNETDEEERRKNRIGWANILIKNKIKDRVGICSFSKNIEELLLWSHYADGAKGICLMFNRDQLCNELEKSNDTVKIRDVEYNGLPTITPKIEKEVEGFEIEQILFNKLCNWKYESEIRAMCIVKRKDSLGIEWISRLLNFSEESLKGVILGERFDSKSRKTIENIIKQCYGVEIPIFKSRKDESNPAILRYF